MVVSCNDQHKWSIFTTLRLTQTRSQAKPATQTHSKVKHDQCNNRCHQFRNNLPLLLKSLRLAMHFLILQYNIKKCNIIIPSTSLEGMANLRKKAHSITLIMHCREGEVMYGTPIWKEIVFHIIWYLHSTVKWKIMWHRHKHKNFLAHSSKRC